MSEKAKDADFCKTTINEYLKSIILEAEDLILTKFPQKVFELEAFSSSANFNISDLTSGYNQ